MPDPHCNSDKRPIRYSPLPSIRPSKQTGPPSLLVVSHARTHAADQDARALLSILAVSPAGRSTFFAGRRTVIRIPEPRGVAVASLPLCLVEAELSTAPFAGNRSRRARSVCGGPRSHRTRRCGQSPQESAVPRASRASRSRLPPPVPPPSTSKP